jgi:hypothetical protein
MALVLNARAGSKFYVGQNWIKVKRIDSPTSVRIVTDEGKRYDLVGDDETEVFLRVWIGIADTDATTHLRLTFDAPPEIVILRSELADRG